MTKKCSLGACGQRIDIYGSGGYVNVYHGGQGSRMESYHLNCYRDKILKEADKI